jgi:PAS domain S-box-containing protein
LFGSLLFFGGASRVADSFQDENIYYIGMLFLAGLMALPTLVVTWLSLPEMLSARPIADLLAANLRFKLLVDHVKDYAIFLLDPQGNISSWNLGAERLTGYVSHEIIGRHFSNFYSEEDRARKHPQEELDLAKKDGRYSEEGWRIRKDGSKFWANTTLTSVYSSDGQLLGFAKVTRDLSAKKEAEEEMKKLNSLLRMRMQALEAFNNSVCHDLNAPVRAMEGFAKAVLEDFSKKLEDEPVLKDYLIRIQKATVRMKNLVRDLMRLAQVSHEDLKATREWFSLTDMALDIVKEEQAYPEHMKHKVVIQPYLMVYGDQALIRLLLHNLLANAFKFSSKKDNPIITVGKANGEFYVRDNGIGFDQQKADLLFRPFSRLHSAADFPGTGIGLTICKRITDIHDGSIRAEGRVDEGATFFFTLGD